MNQARILIVDDEPNVRFVIERTLRDEGYILDSAAGGSEAITKIEQAYYDLALLDLRMQPVNGIQVLSALRERDENTIVIILTAHGSMESAVEALRLGAFDYLFKPADPDTIRERVRDGLRHRKKTLYRMRLLEQIETLRTTLQEIEDDSDESLHAKSAQRFMRAGNLVIDHHHRVATLDGQLLELTTTEFNILVCLGEAAPEPVSALQLVQSSLDYECKNTEAREIAKWHIHHLRKKIEKDSSKPQHIITVRYKGYLWRSR